jgi:hypothetical protein
MKSMIALFALSFALAAHADNSCSVPICDLPQTLATFKAAPQPVRYQTILSYSNPYRNSTDPAVLGNLLAFANGAKQILIDTHDETWMVNSASALISMCNISLAKYSAIDAGTLMGFFKALVYENDRNDVLQSWDLRAKGIEDQASMLQLSSYFSQAQAYCNSQEDDDYVIASAKLGEDTVNARMIELQPVLDGIYALSVTCPTGACSGTALDRLVVMDTLPTPAPGAAPNTDGLQVSLVSSSLGAAIYGFAPVTISNGGTTIESVSRSGTGPLAKLHLDFDLGSRMVTGTLQTTDTTMTIVGRAGTLKAPIQYFNRQVAQPNAQPVPNNLFDQTMHGTFGGQPASLKVNVFTLDQNGDPNVQIGATLSIDSLPDFRIRFAAGRFFPATGILVLVGSPPDGDLIKMTLAFRGSPAAGYAVDGMSMSLGSGVLNDLSFTAAAVPAGAAQ